MRVGFRSSLSEPGNKDVRLERTSNIGNDRCARHRSRFNETKIKDR